MTEQQKLDFKRLDLAEYCIQVLGYKVVKKADSKAWRALLSRNGTEIIVSSMPNANGTYFYVYQQDTEKGGDIFKLLLEVEEKTWAEINEIVGKEVVLTPSLAEPSAIHNAMTTKKLTEAEVAGWLLDCEATPPINYFTKRKIKEEIRKEFSLGATGQEAVKFPNGQPAFSWTATFPLYSFNGEKWVSDCAMTYQIAWNGESWRRFKGAKGSSVSLLIPRSKPFFSCWKNPREITVPTRIVIFESPVDALSWYQIFEKHLLEKNMVLLSTFGTPTRGFLKEFPAMAKALNCELVFLSFDSDEQGEKYTKKVLQVLEKAKLPVGELYPEKLSQHKDWNDVLMGRTKDKLNKLNFA